MFYPNNAEAAVEVAYVWPYPLSTLSILLRSRKFLRLHFKGQTDHWKAGHAHENCEIENNTKKRLFRQARKDVSVFFLNWSGQLPYYCLQIINWILNETLPSNKRRTRITKTLINAAAFNRINTIVSFAAVFWSRHTMGLRLKVLRQALCSDLASIPMQNANQMSSDKSRYFK